MQRRPPFFPAVLGKFVSSAGSSASGASSLHPNPHPTPGSQAQGWLAGWHGWAQRTPGTGSEPSRTAPRSGVLGKSSGELPRQAVVCARGERSCALGFGDGVWRDPGLEAVGVGGVGLGIGASGEGLDSYPGDEGDLGRGVWRRGAWKPRAHGRTRHQVEDE